MGAHEFCKLLHQWKQPLLAHVGQGPVVDEPLLEEGALTFRAGVGAVVAVDARGFAGGASRVSSAMAKAESSSSRSLLSHAPMGMADSPIPNLKSFMSRCVSSHVKRRP